MPRTLSSSINKNLNDPLSGGVWLWLCEIVVPTQNTQNLARNTKNVTYDSTEYTKHNLLIGNQEWNSDGSIPRVTLQVAQDINRTIEDIVNATEGAVDGTVKLIKVCDKFLDTAIPALEFDYDILATSSTDEWVTFTLGIPNPLNKQVPLRQYSSKMCPFATPSLFKGIECGYAGGDSSCTGFYDDCYTKGNAARWGGDLGLDPNGLTI